MLPVLPAWPEYAISLFNKPSVFLRLMLLAEVGLKSLASSTWVAVASDS